MTRGVNVRLGTASVALGVALCAAGCSTSIKRDPAKRDKAVPFYRDRGPLDHGPIPDGLARDAPPLSDGRRDLASADLGKLPDKSVADKPRPPDKAVPDKPRPDTSPVGCDPSCVASNPTTCVKDSTGTCVECLSTANCQQNPGAWGPVCDTSLHYCTCSSDADCAWNNWGHTCDLLSAWCYCVADSECASSVFGSFCDVDYLMCGCLSDADCSAGTCDTSMGICK